MTLLSMESGWDGRRIEAQVAEVRKKQSEQFGVSAAYLLSGEFENLARLRTGKDNPTFHEIGNAIYLADSADSIGKFTVCPRDGEQGCSYLDTLPPEHKGMCTHFVSWSWSYSLETVRSSVESWIYTMGLDPTRVYLWMCFFANNQWRILVAKSATGSDNLKTVFEGNLRRIGRVITILDTWKNPTLLERIWPVFEQFAAIEIGLPVDVILPPDAAATLLEEIERGKEGLLCVREHLSNVHSETAKATFSSDEEAVKQLIRESVGFDAVDQGIKAFLIEWVAVEMKGHLSRLMIQGECDDSPSHLERLASRPEIGPSSSGSQSASSPSLNLWTPCSSLEHRNSGNSKSPLRRLVSPLAMDHRNSDKSRSRRRAAVSDVEEVFSHSTWV